VPVPSYIHRVRTLTGETAGSTRELFQVWKFSGSIGADELMDISIMTGDETMAKKAANADPLDEINVVIWFCQDYLLKLEPHPLDSGESLYSVFCLEKDEASIWGYGVPRMVRDPQAAMNAAWRMLMDNGGLATGDQVIIDDSRVKPLPGEGTRMTPRKVWRYADESGMGNGDVRTAMSTFAIASHLDDLVGVIELCYRQFDDATALPMPAQGQVDETAPSPTPVGTEVLRANAANTVFRRFIKNWDDDITVPTIRRLYDHNMQFNEDRPEIKGDFDVKPRGASVLLVREMQSTNLMALALSVGASPTFAIYQKNVEVLREMYRSLLLNHEQFVLDDESAAQAEQQQAAMMAQAEGGAATDPEKYEVERERISAQSAVAEMENTTRLQVAQLNHETQLMMTAEKLNMSRDQLAAMMATKQMEINSNERKTAAELAIRSTEKAPANQTQVANTT
jgi:hypothetical protein